MAPVPDSFRLWVGGSDLGDVNLPNVDESESMSDDAPEVRLLTTPTKTTRDDGSWFLLWMEETDDGVETMIWEPETPEEIEQATAFYEAACRHEGVEGADGPREVPDDAPPWLRALLDPASHERSSEEQSLLDAILADPDDDAPLLLYADWLTAQGSPQGEFIRVDTALERMRPDDPARPPLDERWTELYEEHAEDFIAPLVALGAPPVMGGELYPALGIERGVAGRVEIEREGVLPERMDELFEFVPLVRELVLCFDDVPLGEIVSHPKMGRIRVLSVSGSECGLDEERLGELAEAQHLDGLRELTISFNVVGEEGAKSLARAPFLPRLRVLDLQGCEIGPNGLAALTERNAFDSLVSLNLCDNGLDETSFPRLAGCTSLARLETLDLGDNRGAAPGVAALAGASFARTLRVLNMSSLSLGGNEEEIAALAGADFAALEELTLGANDFTDRTLEILCRAPWLPGLKSLKLSYNELTSGAGAALARVPFRQLETLDLSAAKLGDEGFADLMKSPHLTTLKDLELIDCGIGPAGVRCLTKARLPALTRLRIDGNAIGLEGAQLLATTTGFELTDLWVDGESVGKKGKKLLKDRYGDAMSF